MERNRSNPDDKLQGAAGKRGDQYGDEHMLEGDIGADLRINFLGVRAGYDGSFAHALKVAARRRRPQGGFVTRLRAHFKARTYSAAIFAAPDMAAEHSAMVCEARAIALVK